MRRRKTKRGAAMLRPYNGLNEWELKAGLGLPAARKLQRAAMPSAGRQGGRAQGKPHCKLGRSMLRPYKPKTGPKKQNVPVRNGTQFST